MEETFDLYLADMRTISCGLLTAQQERDLIACAQAGDNDARKEIIEHNLPLVISMANVYRGRGSAMGDLVQEGNIGLMHAVRKFDLGRNTRFSTCAELWIRQAISRYIQRSQPAVHIPENIGIQMRALQRVRAALGSAPTLDELALGLHMSREDTQALLRYEQYKYISLDASSSEDDDMSMLHTIADLEDAYNEVDEDDQIRMWLRALSPREREITVALMGLLGHREEKPMELARRLGCSNSYVGSTLKRALERLRTMLADNPDYQSRGVA